MPTEPSCQPQIVVILKNLNDGRLPVCMRRAVGNGFSGSLWVWAGVEVGVCVQSLDLTLVVSETFQG